MRNFKINEGGRAGLKGFKSHGKSQVIVGCRGKMVKENKLKIRTLTVGASPAWSLEVSVPLTDRSGDALLSALTMEDRMESPDWEVRSVENDDSFL